jgi:hypothetical protein
MQRTRSAQLVKRTAQLLQRLLPSLTHAQCLNWASKLSAFSDWHEAQKRVASEIWVDSSFDDERLDLAGQLVGLGPDDDDPDMLAETLLHCLGLGDRSSPISLPRIAYLGDGSTAWLALQFDRLQDFAEPLPHPYSWMPSLYDQDVRILPSGSGDWTESRVCEELQSATKKSHGYQLSAEGLSRWRDLYLGEYSKSIVSLHGFGKNQEVKQTRVVPVLSVRSHQQLEAVFALECSLVGSRNSGGLHVVFRILDSIGSRPDVVRNTANALYNAAHENFTTFLCQLKLLTASDPLCQISYEVQSTGSTVNATYSEALEYGLSWEGEI